MAGMVPGGSFATRLALGSGALLAALILAISAVFYFGTVGVLDRSMDGKILAISSRLLDTYGRRPSVDLAREIGRELADGVDSDSEIFLVTAPAGQPLAGNLTRWPSTGLVPGRLADLEVERSGRPSVARLIVQPLPGGGRLIVGRDLSEQRAIRHLVWQALQTAAVVSVVLVAGGAWLLRRQIEARIGGIRRTARAIEAGQLGQRIEISGDDEFARLGRDVNRMLDRIQRLVDGVRHVSNAIAHDLRTPLGRVRTRLDEALRDSRPERLAGTARAAIEDIDDLILLFNKLLQIAEAESGMRASSFEPLDLGRIARDMAELYDAAAEEAGIRLVVRGQQPAWVRGDHDLLATTVASLIDNAIKYAGHGATVTLATRSTPDGAGIEIRDDGPGVPAADLSRLTERFYRLDQARHLPGNGLGLAIVSAITTLHGGQLELANAAPGFRASILLPSGEFPGSPGGQSRISANLSGP